MNPFTDSRNSGLSGQVPPELPQEIWVSASDMTRAAIIQDKTLVVSKDCEFPPICLKSGETEDLVEQKATLYWHPAWVYLFLFFNILIFAIVALAVRKSSKHVYYLSRAEKQKAMFWHVANWIIFLSTFGWIILAVAVDKIELAGFCIISLLASFILYLVKVRHFYSVWIKDDMVHIRGIPLHVMRTIVAQVGG